MRSPSQSEYSAEIRRADADGQVFIIEMGASELMAFVGNLELALRHPANTGPSSKIAAKTRDRLIEMLRERYPVLAATIEAGKDPKFDC